MGYYDCENCGYPLGQDYGFCSKCTPMEWIDFKEDVKSYVRCKGSPNIYFELDKLFENLYKFENYERYREAIEEYNNKKPDRIQQEELLTREELKNKVDKGLFNITYFITKEMK